MDFIISCIAGFLFLDWASSGAVWYAVVVLTVVTILVICSLYLCRVHIIGKIIALVIIYGGTLACIRGVAQSASSNSAADMVVLEVLGLLGIAFFTFLGLLILWFGPSSPRRR